MHRRILRLWLSALLLGLVALFPPAAFADVGVRVEVSATASRVTVSGRLSGDAGQIRRRTVVASVDGTEVGRAKTQGKGRFSVEADVQLAPGRHTATVTVDGEAVLGATEFTVGEADAGDRPTRPTESQRPAAVKVKLTATGPASAINGGMIAVEGQVTAGGRALSGAGITLTDAAGDVPDSFAITGNDGRFQTLYFVPDEQAEGDMDITVSFDGSGGYPSARATVTVPVIRLDDPVATPSVTASPTPTPTATPTPTPTQAPPPSPAPSAETAPPVPAESAGVSPTWIILGLGGLGAVATACAVVVAARRGSILHRHNHPSGPGVGGLDLLDVTAGSPDGQGRPDGRGDSPRGGPGNDAGGLAGPRRAATSD